MSDKQDLGKALVPVNPETSKAVAVVGDFKVPKVPKKKKVLEEEDYEEVSYYYHYHKHHLSVLALPYS